ncbi:DUF5988 family protein [Micromonospora arborensis]|uniref:DUF5988 family protein n=1 Tax=Micromonospora arborensis TaxID=2116518 RepID=UPI0033F6AE21
MDQHGDMPLLTRAGSSASPGDEAGVVEAVLEGGPVGFPVELRRRMVDASTNVVKVRYNGGYEHFGRVVGEPSGDHLAIFQWQGRTRIAE